MEYIIDVQGFRRPFAEFVFKEIAIIPLAGQDVLPKVYLFGPPCHWNSLPVKFKSENSWLERNYHGLKWNDGEIPYEELEEILKSDLRDAVKIYVKGLEKKKWIENIMPDVVVVFNMEDYECPSLVKLLESSYDVPCKHHNLYYKANCAVQNALALKKWLIKYYDSPLFSIYKNHDNEDIKFN